MVGLGQGKLTDFKFVGAKVNEQTMFKARRLEVAQYLGFVFWSQRLSGLQLDNQRSFHQKIRKIITNHGSVLVMHPDGALLLYLKTSFPQSMRERVFVHFLQMPVRVKEMNIVSDLPYPIR